MNSLTRRDFLKTTGAGAALLGWPGLRALGQGATQKRKPNIIFILADDLGYGDLGCYGQQKIKTPNLDRLAAEGVRFTNFYAGSTVCAPSRCTLMTGLDTGHAYIRGNGGQSLRPEDVTVAQVLKQAGYATGLVGKWGLGEEGTTGVPAKKGFDEFFGYLNQVHAHNYYPDFLWRGEKKEAIAGNVLSEKKNVSRVKTVYSNDLFTKEALAFVERHQTEPFFLYLAYTVPHANNEAGAATGNGMEVPNTAPYTNEPWPAPAKGRAAMITRMDEGIGRLLGKVKALGLDENTIVFFTSDNGPHKEGNSDPAFLKDGGPLRGIKRDLYEGGIRVPLIARWPGKVAPGRVSGHIGAFWDFMATAADLAEARVPQGGQGISLLPAILGKPQREHESLYWEFFEGGFKQAARMGNWKAVRLAPKEPVELYDLKADLGETRNVAAEHPGVTARMDALLKRARVESPDWPTTPAGIRAKRVKQKKASAEK